MELIIFFFTLGFSSVLIKLFSNKMGWKVSWLLPIVLGFVIAILTTIFLSINQNKEQVKSDTIPTKTESVTTATSEPVLNEDLTKTEDLTETEAYEFAQELFKKIEGDEKFLRDAFELKEYNTLSKYVLTDWPEYVNRPHRFYPKAQVSYGYKYFPSGDTVSPYTPCDTALIDLNLYAGAMQHLIREDTATMRKILRQEEEDYLKSKARCKKRVDMTYEQALAADENE